MTFTFDQVDPAAMAAAQLVESLTRRRIVLAAIGWPEHTSLLIQPKARLTARDKREINALRPALVAVLRQRDAVVF